MKHIKRITAAALSAGLLLTTAIPAYAQSAPSEKQEVVYIMADSSGAVDDVEVVNIFSGGEITDYGDYSNVKVLNTTDEIHQNGNQISISSASDKVYYQGTMSESVIPWNISVRYFLDGKEYSASEIAGKSGALEIRLSISKNTKCEGSFYEQYALQASFTMNSDKCTNIEANGAAIANVGSNKQISYTILPGKGIETAIRADVTDFEMDAVSLNGLKLNLNIEIDDEKLKNKVSDLTGAVNQLDDGAYKLDGGTNTLLAGSSDLKQGASSLHSANTALDEGILTLQDGLNTVQDGLNSLSSQSDALVNGSSEFKDALNTIRLALSLASADEEKLTELASASGKIKQGISELNTGAAALQASLGYAQYKALAAQNGIDIDMLTAGNANAAETINEYKKLLEEIGKMPEYAHAAEQYNPELLENADKMIGLLNANNAAFGSMEAYLNGVCAELPALTEGLSELNTQYEALDKAIGELAAGIGNMMGKLSALADGINLLVDNYESLSCGIEAYTDGVARIVAGYGQVMNGVSSLAGGSRELVSGSGELYNGTANLYDGVVSLCDGTRSMAQGTDEFRSEAMRIKEKTQDEIDGLLNSIGENSENSESFVAPENTNVDSVQFVIKTAAIEKEKAETAQPAEPKHLSFWQKLLRLFGL